MTRSLLTWPVVAVAAALQCVGSPAGAQTSVQIPLQFDFVNPGAKSLAIGGAFAGLADDATAGFTNPAGLRELGRPEFSIEVRGRALDSLFLQRGRLSGAVQNEGADTIDGPVFGRSRDRSLRVPYASVVFPQPRLGWVVAAYRHELARVDQTYFSEGVFQQDAVELTSRRDSPQEGVRQIGITSYGAAAAIEINRRIAIGAAANVYTFDLFSQFRRFDIDGFLGPPNLAVERGRSTQEGQGLGFGPTLGARVCLKPCEDRQTTAARFGLVYRHGPSFEYDTQDGPNQRRNRFRVPHVVAGGVAVEVPGENRRLVLSGEVKWVGYSRLFDDFVSDQALGTGVADSLRISDGVEVHAGAQYTIESAAWLPRLRVGVWSDPDHSIQFVPGPVADHPQVRVQNELLRVALSTGRRLTHVTGGIGLTVSPAVEWNLGVDLASDVSILSTSLIVKFGS